MLEFINKTKLLNCLWSRSCIVPFIIWFFRRSVTSVGNQKKGDFCHWVWLDIRLGQISSHFQYLTGYRISGIQPGKFPGPTIIFWPVILMVNILGSGIQRDSFHFHFNSETKILKRFFYQKKTKQSKMTIGLQYKYRRIHLIRILNANFYGFRSSSPKIAGFVRNGLRLSFFNKINYWITRIIITDKL